MAPNSGLGSNLLAAKLECGCSLSLSSFAKQEGQSIMGYLPGILCFLAYSTMCWADERWVASWLFQRRGMFFLSQTSGLGEMMEGSLNFCSGQR